MVRAIQCESRKSLKVGTFPAAAGEKCEGRRRVRDSDIAGLEGGVGDRRPKNVHGHQELEKPMTQILSPGPLGVNAALRTP